MPSAPTTSLDLTSADLVADPYPHFAAERSAHEVAWHEPSGSWLAFSHRAVSRSSATGDWAACGTTGSLRNTSNRSTCCTATR